MGKSNGGSGGGSTGGGPEKKTGVAGLEGILTGLSGLFQTLGELAEKGQEIKREFESNATDPKGRDVKFHYGFTVKTLNNGSDVSVEPFGNLKRDERTGEAVVAETREPMADVFEETDHVMVVLEMPGVSATDVKTELNGDVMTVSAEHGSKRYRKEVLLPGEGGYDAAKVSVSCNNGVVEVRCGR
jgi:HSP20 family protein